MSVQHFGGKELRFICAGLRMPMAPGSVFLGNFEIDGGQIITEATVEMFRATRTSTGGIIETYGLTICGKTYLIDAMGFEVQA